MQPSGLSFFPLLVRRAAPRLVRLCGWGALWAAATIASAATYDPTEPIAPIRAPFPMPQLQRPVFPARVVSIADHGAVADGTTKNTAAFARAIAAAAEAGGGRVVVPAGRWLTGPIHLRSNIELHLAEGAVVVFSDAFEDYLPPVLLRVGGVELFNYSPFIYARDCENVGITGAGRLDGNAAAWHAWKNRETKEIFQLAPKGIPVERRIFGTPEAAIRPNFVVFVNCRNVLWEGFTIGGGANWMLHPVYCENLIIRRVHVLSDGPNNDGIDPDSCRNVLIEHCVFDTGDDCVVLKSGYNEDGWRVARPMENLVMRWCSSHRGHGGLVIGSEMSGDVRNVYMHDCDFDGTDRAVRIKSRRDRGGIVENVWVENLRVKNMQHEVVIMNMDYTADRNQVTAARAPIFRRISIKNVTADGAPVAIRLTGIEESPIREITFADMKIASTEGVIATHVRDLRFERVEVTAARGPAFSFREAQNVVVHDSLIAASRGIDVAGASSRNIVVESLRDGAPEPKVTLAPDVAPDVVQVRRAAGARPVARGAEKGSLPE
ncbi:MAG TPA: glycoside hydrolase family 28 protein [Acidobacteriota bacterium]|nr:glycoside hydrolase family 28 protein [Acidobacteriota bacterium]